jgi:hypothetical protein
MKHKNGLTLLAGFLFATAALSTVPSAQAGQCSLAGAAGKYGFTLTGTLLLPTGPVPGAAVGTLTVDAEGKISGTEARNVGGGFANETIKGQWTVNSDCTATASFQVYASDSGALVRKTVFSFVFVDNSTEFFAVEQSLTAPDGTVVPAVITVNGKRLFPEG